MGNITVKDGSGGGVQPIDLREALEERYLAYALSTIMHRALPDARDGLKPVHRRLLYAMRQLKLDPGQGFKKCARVVGDVIGKYHPHGDQSVYDALVRLAQDFAVRFPLVDGQGNFGNVDGDGAAAMRYTEARLTEVARLLLDGLDEGAVDFRDTYDGEDSEPIVLPGAFPNLLANGSTGIAVGMATSIPPHNAAEVCAAAQKLIETPDVETEALMELLPGPDLPTGGILVEPRSSMLKAYETGRGSFRLRARWSIEDQGRGTYTIVVTEIPYQVQKAKLIERIADLIQTRKLPVLADVRDESAEDVRIVLEPRARTVDADLLMESLFKLTDLEVRISLNMNVLVGGRVPKVIGLKAALREWVEHRRVVLVRRSEHRVEKIARRMEVLGGYLVAYLNLDEVIRIIREEDEPKASLMATFELTDVQAEAILNMRLRALRKLEEMEIRREYDALEKEKGGLETLLGSEKRQWNRVSSEIGKVGKAFGPDTPLGRRRTSFADAPEADEAAIQRAMVEREPITVLITKNGWVRALKGHTDDVSGVSLKAGDALAFAFKAETTDKIVLLSREGRAYTLNAERLPGGRGQGEPVRLMVDLAEGDDIAAAFRHALGTKRLLAASDGRGFIAPEAGMIGNARKGKQVFGIGSGARLVVAASIKDTDDLVATLGDNRKLLLIPREQVPELTRGRGMRLQKFKDGGLADAVPLASSVGLTWVDSSGRANTRAGDEIAEYRGDRAQAGRVAPRGFPKANRFDASGLKVD